MTEWVSLVPYALHAFRCLLVPALAAVPRNHPWRELLLIEIVLLAIASDLVDGAVARALAITHLESLYWTDHGADLVFIFGAILVIGGKLSFARDRSDAPPSREERRTRRNAERWSLALHITLTLLLVLAVTGMMFLRAFRQY